MQNNYSFPSFGFMRLSQVLSVIPVSKSSWHNGVAEGRFPKPVHLGPRTSAYRVEDIVALVEKLSSQVKGQENEGGDHV